MMKTKIVKRFMAIATIAVMLLCGNVQASGLNDLESSVRNIENAVNSGTRMVNTVESVGKTLGLTPKSSDVSKQQTQKSLKLIQQDTKSAPTIDGFIWYGDNGQEYTGGITNGNVAKVHELINKHMTASGVVFFSESDSADFLKGYGLQELTENDIPQWIMDAIVQKGWAQVWAYKVTGSSKATIQVNPTTSQNLKQLPQLPQVEEIGIDTLDVQYGQVLCINENGAEVVDLSTSELLKKFAKKQMPNGISIFVAPRSYVQDAFLLWQTAGQEMTQSAHDNAGGHLYNMSQLGNLSVLTKEQVAVAEQAFGTDAGNLACFKINRQTLNASFLDKVAVFSRKVNDITDVVGKVVNIGKGKWKQALGIYDYDW